MCPIPNSYVDGGRPVKEAIILLAGITTVLWWSLGWQSALIVLGFGLIGVLGSLDRKDWDKLFHK